jgi:hypothetical protein
MANAFLNPVAVPGMWGDNIPAPSRVPAIARNPVAPATDTFDNAHSVATKPKAVAWVRMAPDILRAMAFAAKHAGRTAGDVWAEAARDWLLRKSLEADYDALANMPQRRRDGAALEEKRSRLWGSIDSMMSDIRQLRPTL